MNSLRPICNHSRIASIAIQIRASSGGLGSGVTHGGGGGGSIRSAGGAFGEQAVAREEQYFHEKQSKQMKKLKHDLIDEIGFHEKQIQKHLEAIDRHKQRVQMLDNKQ